MSEFVEPVTPDCPHFVYTFYAAWCWCRTSSPPGSGAR